MKLYCAITGTIFTITGVAKVAAVLSSHAELFFVADPITGLQFRYLMLVAGVLELLLATVCYSVRCQTYTPIIIAWFATSMLAYRLGLWAMGWHRPCPCLGNFTDAIHVSPVVADSIMKGIMAYLLASSYGVVFYRWWKGKQLAIGNSRN